MLSLWTSRPTQAWNSGIAPSSCAGRTSCISPFLRRWSQLDVRADRPSAEDGHATSLFAGSDGGARHWAVVASLVATAKLNGVEPQAWLTDVLERMVSGRTKAHELERLLPWHWHAERAGTDLKAA